MKENYENEGGDGYSSRRKTISGRSRKIKKLFPSFFPFSPRP